MEENYIKTELAKYNVPDAKIAEMKAEYLPLVVKDPADLENYVTCREAHQQVKKVRVSIEAKRKELKSSSLEFGRAVDNEAKRLTQGVAEVENHLLAQRKIVEDEKKRQDEEKERLEREEGDRIKREEEARLETQRKEQEEIARKQAEEQAKIDEANRKIEEEKEKNRLEAERLERDKKEAEETKIRAEQEEKDRIGREKRHAEEVEKAKIEAAEQAKKEEKERIEHEAKEKEVAEVEAKRQEALKPDIEKIKKVASTIASFEFPEVSSERAKQAIERAKNDMVDIAETLITTKL